MPAATPSRGTLVAIAIGVGALLLARPLWKSTESQVYCYQSVNTLASSTSSGDCFDVSSGKFTRVYYRQLSATATKISPGHVIPGLWDGHGHLLGYGEFLQSVDLFGSKSVEDVRQRTREYLKSHPSAGSKEQWLRGIGWNQNDMGGRMPTAVSPFPKSTWKGTRSDLTNRERRTLKAMMH